MAGWKVIPAAGRVASCLRRGKTACIVILSIAGCGLVVLGWFTAVHWPYRYREIHPLLIQAFGSEVKITHYRRVYLPHPGFTATGITITRASTPHQPPFGTVETLYVQGEWNDLLMLRRRVHLVEMTSVHITIPAAGSRASREAFPAGSASGFGGPTTAIEILRLHNSLLEVQYDSGESLKFAIRSLELRNVEKGHAVQYTVDMENAKPAGHIRAEGSFGPLNARDVGATPLSGRFTYDHVKLSDIGELHGTLASTGRFSGPLRSIEANAVSNTPDFAVNDGRPTQVQGSVQCVVNGMNGDVTLSSVEATSGQTIVRGRGQVAGSPKITMIDLAVDHGRAEEILRPFMHQNAPASGAASLQAHAWVGPVGKPFLQRLRVEGKFDLPATNATDANIERSLSAFSEREVNKSTKSAAGLSVDPSPRQPAHVLSLLGGPVTIRNGIVATSDLLYQVPGAHVRLHGTFNLDDESVHLVGTLEMQSGISQATTGWKSVLLKPFSAFFKRKHHSGSQIPIAVTGIPGRYKVTQDISHTK